MKNYLRKYVAMNFSEFGLEPNINAFVFFKLGKLWVFKYFFNDRKVYDDSWTTTTKTSTVIEFKSLAQGTTASKILERNGFDYEW